MSRVYCVVNQKGGVGKTTTAISVAAGIARAGFATLLLDFDPQCNATSGLGFEPSRRHPLATGQPIQEAVRRSATERLDILTGCQSFRDVEAMASEDRQWSERMKKQLDEGFAGYDYVLIDCPPSISQLTHSALEFSTNVLVPIQCEYYAMEGLARMMETILKIFYQRREPNPEGGFVGGFVLTMHDPSLELTHEVESQVRDYLGEVVYQTVIPRDVSLSEAPSFGKSIFEYAPRSRGARAYTELCLEVLERV